VVKLTFPCTRQRAFLGFSSMTIEQVRNGGDSDTFTGYVYCPPNWDEARLVTPGPELSRLQYVLLPSRI
jgi:hypothetical protein